MGSFFRGVLVGVGLSLVFAPRPGPETRQLLMERLQRLRGTLPDHEESHLPLPSQPAAFTHPRPAAVTEPAPVQPRAASPQPATPHHVEEPAETEKRPVPTTQQPLAPPPAPPTPATAQPKATASSGETQPLAPPTPATAQPKAAASPGETRPLARTNLLTSSAYLVPETLQALKREGIETRDQLLQQASTKDNSAQLAQKAGIDLQQLRKLVIHTDLMRVKGLDQETAALLEEAGVVGCSDLRQRNPEHLLARITEAQVKMPNPPPAPTPERLHELITQAKTIRPL